MRILLIIGLLFSFKPLSSQITKPFVLGNIEEIQSAILSEKRILNVYLPEGYNPDDTVKYPVIYLLDGSGDEDFIHIAGLMQFATFSWVDMLPKSILVGIANVDRERDFTYPTTVEKHKMKFLSAGGSEKFIRFIETELQPYIESKYKTNAVRTLIGQSLGGLLATEILYRKPALFSKYIIVSPSLWWDNASLLKSPLPFSRNAPKDESLNTPPAGLNPRVEVYIAVGKGEERQMIVDARTLFKLLKLREKDIIVDYELLKDENHATIMHEAIYRAFRKFHRWDQSHAE